MCDIAFKALKTNKQEKFVSHNWAEHNTAYSLIKTIFLKILKQKNNWNIVSVHTRLWIKALIVKIHF